MEMDVPLINVILLETNVSIPQKIAGVIYLMEIVDLFLEINQPLLQPVRPEMVSTMDLFNSHSMVTCLKQETTTVIDWHVMEDKEINTLAHPLETTLILVSDKSQTVKVLHVPILLADLLDLGLLELLDKQTLIVGTSKQELALIPMYVPVMFVTLLSLEQLAVKVHANLLLEADVAFQAMPQTVTSLMYVNLTHVIQPLDVKIPLFQHLLLIFVLMLVVTLFLEVSPESTLLYVPKELTNVSSIIVILPQMEMEDVNKSINVHSFKIKPLFM